MDKLPLVSIIIPVYNVATYIGQCIDSVIAQSYQNIEVILVDDCGSDDSIAIAEQKLEDCVFNWKTVRHGKNRGLSAARNTGVDSSDGEYIFFLDSDDFITEDCIEKLHTAIHESGADMAYGSYYWPSIEADRNLDCFNISTDRVRRYSHLVNYINEFTYATAHNRLIKKDSYIQTGIRFIEGILHEDDPWSFELALKMRNICGISDKTYCYQERESSIMGGSHLAFDRVEGRLHALTVFSRYANHPEVRECEYFDAWYCSRFWSVLSYIAQSPDIPSWKKIDLQRKMFNGLYLPVNKLCSHSLHARILLCAWKIIPENILFWGLNTLYKFKSNA